MRDDLIRDRIVCGVLDNGIRRKLLQESGLTLSKCVDIYQANEATAAQLKHLALSQTTKQEANAVNQKESSKKPKTPKENGKEWERDKCPAYGKICSSCGKANHFAAKCSKNSRESTKKRSLTPFKRKKVNPLDDITEVFRRRDLVCLWSTSQTPSICQSSRTKFANELVKMRVDSGASSDVLPRKFLPRDTEIKKTNLKLTTYSKTNLKGARHGENIPAKPKELEKVSC